MDGIGLISLLLLLGKFVLTVSVIEFIPGLDSGGLKSLRTLRVIRPLKSINAIPSMRRLVRSLLKSLPALLDVVVFLMFVFVLFGILGTQQFNGAMYNLCRTTAEPTEPGVWPKAPIERLCSQPLDGGMFTCPKEYTCGSPGEFGITIE